MPKEFTSIQKQVENYLKLNPAVRNALHLGIVNYSKVSRKIISDLKNPDLTIDSIIISCRRIYESHKKLYHNSFNLVSEILSATSLQIRNKVSTIILDSKIPILRLNALRELSKNKKNSDDVLYIIEGRNAITVIVSDNYLTDIKKRYSKYIIKTNSNLVEVILKSSSRLEEVPGVAAHIYSLLAENDINVIETMSCWTDTIIIIDLKYLPKAMTILDFS